MWKVKSLYIKLVHGDTEFNRPREYDLNRKKERRDRRISKLNGKKKIPSSSTDIRIGNKQNEKKETKKKWIQGSKFNFN